jgi:Protein of unknown function (DUF4232)
VISKLSLALVLAAACSAAILTGCASGTPAPASPPPATTQTSAASPAAGAATSSAQPSTNAANGSAGTATAAAPPECSAAQLKITYTDNSAINNGALDGMSHHDSVIMFTNAGSGSCQTRGYPGVALLNAAGQQVKQAVRSGLSRGPAPLITLRPGQVASAGLLANSASCTSLAKVSGVLVTAPDQTTSTRLGPPNQPLCLNSVTIGWLVPGNAGGTGA